MGCIPPKEDTSFVCHMEQVLGVYKRPYDPRRPVVCMDEQPKQLIFETRQPLPARPGKPQRVDYQYVREGVCCVWRFVEPLGGWRDVPVTPTKKSVDWAQQVKRLVDQPRYSNAERITLVCDNLNTHKLAWLYAAFEPTEAMRLSKKLELVHTPKHGSWLNMAEPELSVLSRQCFDERIDNIEAIAHRSAAWSKDRNQRQTGIDWQFTTEKARTKLKSLYPKVIA